MRRVDRSPPAGESISIGAAVAQLQERFSDISHSSLRFLEREGFISSQRTSGGHRLYTNDDIEHVALIKRWQAEGLSLSQIRQRLSLRDALQDPAELSGNFFGLLKAHRLEEAERLILDADRAGLEPQTMFFDVLRPAMVAIGQGWANGEISVFHEKEASEVCRELVTDITLRHAPDFAEGPLLVAACVEGERHEIGLRMVYGLLRQRGYRVRYLGADVATVFLVDAIENNDPIAVLLSSSVEQSFDGCMSAVRAINDLRSEDSVPLVVVGGEVVERRRQELADLGAVPMRDEHMMSCLDELLSTA